MTYLVEQAAPSVEDIVGAKLDMPRIIGVAKLTERERAVFESVILGDTYASVGVVHGVSDGRIAQIYHRSLRKLRNAVKRLTR